jgi:hypothetical protein
VRVGDARGAAVDWVRSHATRTPGFRGAYFAGSTVGLPADAELPVGSDVDVMVVTAAAEPGRGPGKFVHRGALPEASHVPWDQLASADDVLASYHLAAGVSAGSVVADPTGHLRRLHADVSRRFAQRAWVRRRCEDARRRSENGLRRVAAATTWPEQVTTWLFAGGVATHVLLVAALRNPTVRLRYLAARDVLERYGLPELHEDLLGLLGCADMTPPRAEHHLRTLARTFDAAAAVVRTPFFFASDITPHARPIAVDGTREQIAAGHHREVVFWIVATFARCQAVLAADAPPDVRRDLAPAFDELLADLGIGSPADLLARADHALRFLRAVWETAEAVMAANPEIADDGSGSR